MFQRFELINQNNFLSKELEAGSFNTLTIFEVKRLLKKYIKKRINLVSIYSLEMK